MVWIFMGSGGFGVLPQEILEIWSAQGVILGLFLDLDL